jgi:hypothetical protein
MLAIAYNNLVYNSLVHNSLIYNSLIYTRYSIYLGLVNTR